LQPVLIPTDRYFRFFRVPRVGHTNLLDSDHITYPPGVSGPAGGQRLSSRWVETRYPIPF
jgi:hypothetical protein